MFHPGWRQRSLARLGDLFDLVIVGGGITGCGVFLDAAQRGLHTLLVERGDIACGTSSRSSKLIHGGLRYLKQMQFRITLQACRERDRMVALNPHLVWPVRFLYPAYHGDRVPGWKVDLGLWMYDRLTARPEKHQQLTPAELEELAPGVALDDLERVLAYNDAVADDARLTLAVASTGHAFGGHLLTRCEALEAVTDTGATVCGVRVRDLETGVVHRVSARVVLNASGVWVDQVRERMGRSDQRVRPSRGIHLILPSQVAPVGAAVTFPSPDDGRPVFLVPHPEGTLLGTTDLYHSGDLDDPRPTREEVTYLLRAAAAAFPGRAFTEDQARGAFAGLRPILDIHAEEPSEASREEDVWEESGMLSVAGGKLTTWRSTAEEAVDRVIELLPEDRARRAGRCATKGTPVGALAPADLSQRLLAAHPLPPEIAAGAARRLGALAWIVPQLARRRKELQPLVPGLDLCVAEVRAHLRFSAVLRLEDLVLRRVRLGMWQPDAVHQVVRALRPVFASELGWRYRRWQDEVEAMGSALQAWTLAGVRPSEAVVESAHERGR